MTTIQHTPGPWQWVADNAGQEDEYGCAERGPIDIGTYRAPGYYNNAELDAANGERILGCGEYNVIHGATPQERIANASLIAAAPDLLAALQNVMAMYDSLTKAAKHGADCPCYHCQARAAIAKATGA